MKWDKIESFIIGHRDDIDDKIPPTSSWERIESKLKSKRIERSINYWQAAAVVFFILSLGLILNNFRTVDKPAKMAQQDSEFMNTEEYYFKVIEDKQMQLTTYLKQYPDLAGDFKKDLGELSTGYQKLKREYDKTETEEVLSALILNLQLQQELLNNQLHIINFIKEENENVSI